MSYRQCGRKVMRFLRAWHLEPCVKFSWVYSSLPSCQCAGYEGVWGSEAIAHSFLTSLLDGGEVRSGLNFGRFTSKNEFLRHPLKRRLDLVWAFRGKKWMSCLYREIEAEFIGRAARNLYVLHQLSYPGCKTVTVTSTLHCSMSAVNSWASLNFPRREAS
jgi:hypothetical protein